MQVRTSGVQEQYLKLLHQDYIEVAVESYQIETGWEVWVVEIVVVLDAAVVVV